MRFSRQQRIFGFEMKIKKKSVVRKIKMHTVPVGNLFQLRHFRDGIKVKCLLKKKKVRKKSFDNFSFSTVLSSMYISNVINHIFERRRRSNATADVDATRVERFLFIKRCCRSHRRYSCRLNTFHRLLDRKIFAI